MKIFMTGASGYIGWAVARRLVKDGHDVVGLTHNEKKAEALRAGGVRPVVGDLSAPASFRKDADACEALIHLAFQYGPQGQAADKTALEALIASSAGAKPLIYTSGVWVLGPTKGAPADESAAPNPPPIVAWRPAHEKLALAAGGAVTRPGCVYGERAGLFGMLFKSIVEERQARVVGDGAQCWATVYLDDVAQLYSLILAKRAKGVFHAASGEPESARTVAEALADAAGGAEVKPWPLEEARKALGAMADALAMDQRVSSAKATRELGWRPTMTSPAKNARALLAQWEDKGGLGLIA